MPQQIATATETYTAVPGTPVYETTFAAPLDPSVAGQRIESLSLDLTISGIGVAHGYVRLAGASFATLPILDTGTVEVAVDSATFSPTRTVAALVAPDGTWTAEVTTPTTGQRVLHARAVQHGTAVHAEPVAVTVVP